MWLKNTIIFNHKRNYPVGCKNYNKETLQMFIIEQTVEKKEDSPVWMETNIKA